MIKDFKFKVVFSIFFLMSISLMGQELTLLLELDDDTIGYFDPIKVHIKGYNIGGDTIDYPIVSRYFRPYFQFKEVGTDAWKEISESNITPNYPCVLDLDDSPATYIAKGPFFRGDSNGLFVDYSTWYYPTNGRNSKDFVFTHSGLFYCRLVVRPFYNDTSVLYSNVVTLFVRKYSRRDRRGIKKVLEFIAYPRLLFYEYNPSLEWVRRYPIMHDRERILRLRLKSIYVDYLKQGVLAMYVNDRWFVDNSLVLPSNLSYPKDKLPSWLELRDMQLKLLRKSKHPSFKALEKWNLINIKELEIEFRENGRNPDYIWSNKGQKIMKL